MYSAVWKLSGLAAVVGLGLLAVFSGKLGSFGKTLAEVKATAEDPNAVDPFATNGETDPKKSVAATSSTGATNSGEQEPPILNSEGGDDADFGDAGRTVASRGGTQPRTTPRGLDLRKLPPDQPEISETEAFDSKAFEEQGDPLNSPTSGPGESVASTVAPRSPRPQSTLTEEDGNESLPVKSPALANNNSAVGTGSSGAPPHGHLADDEEPLTGASRPKTPAQEVAIEETVISPRGAGTRDVSDDTEFTATPPGNGAIPRNSGTRPRVSANDRLGKFSDDDEGVSRKSPTASGPSFSPSNIATEEESGTTPRTTPRNAPLIPSKRTRPGLPDDDPFNRQAGNANAAIAGNNSPTANPEEDQIIPANKPARPRPASFLDEGDGSPTNNKPTNAPLSTNTYVDGPVGTTTPGTPNTYVDDPVGPTTSPRNTGNRSSRPSGALTDDEGVGRSSGSSAGTGSRTTRPANAFEEEPAEPMSATHTAPRTAVNPPRTIPGSPRPRGKVIITKSAPPQAVLGQPLIYQINIRNIGEGVAQQVVVEDPLPPAVDIVGSIPQAELIGRRMVWKIGNLQPGEERRIAVKIIPKQEGPVGSSATVNFLAEADLANPIDPAGNITLDMKTPMQARVGDKVTMNFQVTNHTAQPAKGVVLRNLLPKTLQHPGGADLAYPVGDLAPGESRPIELQLTAAEIGPATGRVIVTADNSVVENTEFSLEVVSDSPAAQPKFVASDVERTGANDSLSISRGQMGKISLNRPTAFPVIVQNRGEEPVENVVVRETLPVGIEFLGSTTLGSYDASTRQVEWTIAELAPGSRQELSWQGRVTQRGELQTELTAQGPQGFHDQTTTTLTASAAPLLDLRVHPPEGHLAVGSTFPVEFVLANKGSEPAQQVGLRVIVPSELRLTEISADYKQQGEVIVIDPIPELEPGDEVKHKLVFQANSVGATPLHVEFTAAHLKRPLARDELISIE